MNRRGGTGMKEFVDKLAFSVYRVNRTEDCALLAKLEPIIQISWLLVCKGKDCAVEAQC